MPGGRQLIRPMLATPGVLPSERQDADWAYEFKWDGVRAIVYAEGGELAVFSRNDRDVSVSYPETMALLDVLGGIDAVVDGELVAFEQGRPSFGTLQHRMHVADPAEVARLALRIPVSFVIFDLLRLQGQSLLRLPYTDRRALLAELEINDGPLLTAVSFDGSGEQVFQASREQGMEGIIAKRRDSIYEPGRRSSAWRKIKHFRTQEVVIGGWSPGAGGRSGQLGSLMMGIPESDGLRYIGQVGTGFTQAVLASLGRDLARIERPSSPFTTPVPGPVARTAHWVEPILVGEVSYGEWTGDGVLRHPSWRGLRPDKTPGDVRPE